MSKVKTRTRSETSKSDETVKKTKSTTNVNIDPDDNQVNSVVDLVLARRLRSALKGSESDSVWQGFFCTTKQCKVILHNNNV